MDGVGERAAYAIRQHCAQNGIRISAEKKKLDINSCTLFHWEHGEHAPTSYFLRKMALAGYDVMWILTGEESKVPHENCKKYDTCEWRKSVGYCPDNCNHFKHKDEVVVTRCRDCKHWCYEYDDIGLCTTDVPDIDGVQRVGCDFCSYGERRIEDE